MPTLLRLQFTADIAAPVSTVFQTMLDPQHYRVWTAPFSEGSYYVGRWAQGESIRFLAPSGDGMLSEIVEHQPDVITSIRHLGMILQGVEDTQSEAVRAWAPAFETYRFSATPTGTRVVVDQDVPEAWAEDLKAAWPLALAKLKALCEPAG